MTSLIAETGFLTLLHASRDTHLLILQRVFRLIAYGQSTLVLAAYLSALGVTDFRIGLFMTLTLAGDIAVSAVLTVYADRWGRRKVLLVGSLLMSMSGVVFALSGNYWILLAAATAGVISPSGNEVGPFKALEESTLAHLTPPQDRSTVFAWYAVISGVAGSLGSLSGGWMTQTLQDTYGLTEVEAYRKVFYVYTLCGLVKSALSVVLSPACESALVSAGADKANHESRGRYRLLETGRTGAGVGEEEDDLGDEEVAGQREASAIDKQPPTLVDRVLGLSPTTRHKLLVLSALFGLDNLASGLVPLSFTIYYFTTKFHLDAATLGTTFFTTSFIAALSNLVAASLARRLGNIRTMALTHLPSSTLLALLPLPNDFFTARAILIARFCTAQMDGAPRTAFIASYVPDHERTSVMGIINIVKTLCQSAGPSVTGYLAGRGAIRWSFFAAGGMKVSYDLMILYFFTQAAAAS